MRPSGTLDLTALDNSLKYHLLLEAFDALTSENKLLLKNDGPLRPYFYRLTADRGQKFRWDQLESGPEKWVAGISKYTIGNDEEPIGKIVSRDYRKSNALYNHGIDFSCGGHQSLSQILEGNDQSMAEILKEWNRLDLDKKKNEMDFGEWDLAFLTKYIVQLHHNFVRSQTKFITEMAFKVADTNSSRNPEIKAAAYVFGKTGKLLEDTVVNEEQLLLPYIVKLAECSKTGGKVTAPPFGHISIPIASLHATAEAVVADLGQIKTITNYYSAPAYTSSTCTILYKLLADYEKDAHVHLHLKHNILFPRAIQTEHILRKNNQIIE